MSDINTWVESTAEAFAERFGKSPEFTATAPGRINLIGEHTDYNGGLALPAAINRWVAVSMGRRSDTMAVIRSDNYREDVVFDLEQRPRARKLWEKYVLAVLEVFGRKHGRPEGFDMLIRGNVPPGAGLSSSAALEVSLFNALRQFYQADISNIRLCKDCQSVEHHFIGVKSGLLDQWASQFSKKDHILYIDFFEGGMQRIKVDMGEASWVVINSKVSRELAGSRYQDRVEETALAQNEVRLRFPDITHLRELELSRLEEVKTGSVWKSRVRHFLTENQRVKEMRIALAQQEMEWAGKLLRQSHESLSKDYETSCPELDFLAGKANEHPDCYGSRIMGGGFGGCTLNLVPTEKVDDFVQSISKAYQESYRAEPESYVFELSGGATIFPHDD